jgi:hypothetical protein
MNSTPAVFPGQSLLRIGLVTGTTSATALQSALGEATILARADYPQFLSFLLLSPSESHAGPPTVLIDELDPGSL